MRVTVVAILETEFSQEPALAKIMNNRLLTVAKELQDLHLFSLSEIRSPVHSLTIYLSYNQKYKIRYRMMDEVPADVAYLVAERCGRLGYILDKLMVTAPSKIV